jgi:uncharacterized protein YPO0396
MIAIAKRARAAMKPNNYLSLTRIFLHNWHRFKHHVIDVEDSLYLAGHNGSGKSSVLDAIQLVLIADQTRVRYNSSAQERSARNLNSYVRGKIGENRYLRPGNTVGYIVLEFQSESSQICIGVCIEASENHSPERSFFILSETLDQALFLPQGKPLTRRELRQSLRQRKGARFYDQVSEYQDDMLNRLGGLNQRFFDLFIRALTFQPIRDINSFVEQWLLEAQPLQVTDLKRVVDNLRELEATAQNVEQRTHELQAIVKQQQQVRTWRRNQEEYALLAKLLRLEQAQRSHHELLQQRDQLRHELEQTQSAHNDHKAVLEGSLEALVDAETRLRQSDVVQRQQRLQQEITRLSQEANQIRSVYTTLLSDFKRQAALLEPLRPDSKLSSIAALLDAIGALSLDAPPDSHLKSLLASSEQELDAARELVTEQRISLKQQLEERTSQRAQALQELARLRAGQRAHYDPNVERMRDLLEHELENRPLLLCELIEIPDERWQNAVEAMLGQRRFNIVVPPERFGKALSILEEARARQQIYDVGLIDLAKASSDAKPAQAGSLAQQVSTNARLIRSYIDTVLGDIITCETPHEMRQYRRAITAEVMVYSEWTARAIPPKRYQPWFIGKRAKLSQIEALEKQIADLEAEINQLQAQISQLQRQEQQLNHGRALSHLAQRLDLPLDDRNLRAEIAELQDELQSLDLSGVEALRHEVERLKAMYRTNQQEHERATKQLVTLQNRLEQIEKSLQYAHSILFEQQQFVSQLQQAKPDNLPHAEQLLQERLQSVGPASSDMDELLRNADNSARNFETRATNALTELGELGVGYNTRHQFAGQPRNIDDNSYINELDRLETSELPRYRDHITQAQREAEEELREHVLHRLHEQILQARSKLDMINAALKKLTFHGESYRFRSQAAEDVQHFFELIEGSQGIGKGSLFESDFYQQHQASFDSFYQQLVLEPQSDAERREQERLIDYRRYLTYDIEVTHANGQSSRLSRIMGQTSGGETQTPFYLTIAASFVQLYHINERNSRPTIRLVAFDEAFSKMDQDRIGATLELFQQFGLQIITATPLERCEYLVPSMCTSLVLSAVGDGVWIEPYRNYAARLQGFAETEA